MDFKVIVTLGPAILNEEKLKEIWQHGPCIFRINGAHTEAKSIKDIAGFVRSVLPDAELMLDLPGNKVRIQGLSEPLKLVKGECFDVHKGQLNFPEFHRYLKPGDIVLAHDSIYRLEVEKVDEETIRFLSHSDGLLMNLKGLHIKGVCSNLPFLFSKDLDLIKEACDCQLNYLALSFVRDANDICAVKEILEKYRDSCPEIIAKVETHAAVENLDDILSQTDSILVDRGDLSSEIGMHDLAHYQEKIIQDAKREGKNIYLATQFLKNMEKNPLPLIAETLDLHKTLKTGINGIQLSEETAVGVYPVQCVEYVFRAYNKIFNGAGDGKS